MPQVLSFPFRVAPTGRPALVEQDSEQAAVEKLAMLALTRRGERDLAVDVGISDPAFAGFDAAEFAGQVARWGPRGVALQTVDVEPAGPGVQRVTVSFR
jgi:hypothetical protein